MSDNAGLSQQLRPYLQDTVYSYCNKRRSQAGTELEAFSLLVFRVLEGTIKATIAGNPKEESEARDR